MNTAHKERFLVIGGLGYIGSAFAKRALQLGHEVLLFDSLIYEQNRHRMLKEIAGPDYGDYDQLLEIGDTRNLTHLKSVVQRFEPTFVMHWGDLSSVYSCNHNPTYTEDICFRATKGIVDLCAERNLKLLYNSSSSVYGVQAENRLMTETDKLPETSDLYCHYKLAIERYIQDKKAATPGFKAIVFRPATVCGLSPRLRIELLPNHFTYMALAHDVIKVSDLNAYRAAIDVDEMVNAYFKVIAAKSWEHLIYNLGHHNLSKIEYALGIQRVLGCKIVTVEDYGNLRNLQIDCTRFDEEFGFKPQTTYETTVGNVANWLKPRLDDIRKAGFPEMLNMPLAEWLKIST